MSSYVISCCSTADLTEEHFSKREISYICFHYKLNDTEYADDLGKSMPFDQFYAAMAAGASTKTSQVNADEFEAYFETFLQDGKDILHVCLSSGISGVLNSAMIAKADLEERYPERKILIVDSLGASSGYGLLMDRLADLRDEGKPLEEVYDFAMKTASKSITGSSPRTSPSTCAAAHLQSLRRNRRPPRSSARCSTWTTKDG